MAREFTRRRQAEEALRLYSELDKRAGGRTRELSKANIALNQETAVPRVLFQGVLERIGRLRAAPG